MPAISAMQQQNRRSGEIASLVALPLNYDKQEGPKMVAFVHVSRGIIWVKLFARMVKQGTTSLEHAAAHAAHTTHATAHTAHGRSTAGRLRGVNDGDLGGAEERGDTRGVHETGADDLEGIKDTSSDHVDVLALGGVKALVEVTLELVHELANNNGALKTSIFDNGASGLGDGGLDDRNTELLVEVLGLELIESVGSGLEKGSATTGKDTLLDGSAGGVESVDHAVLLLADLDLGSTTNLDDSNAAGKLGKTLLELLLLIVTGSGVVHDATDLLAAGGDSILVALTVKNDGVLLGDGDRSSRAEHLSSGLLELDVELVSEDGTVGENTEVTKNALAVVAEAGSLDGSDLELTAELVENADSKSLTVDVLGDDDKGPAELLGSLKSRDDVLNGGDLLLGEEDKRLLELDLLRLGVGDEVGGDEATVKLHALSNLKLILNSLALLHGDDTLLADLLHCLRKELANELVAVGGDGGDLANLVAGGDVALVGLEVLDNGLDGSLGTSAEVHGVAAGSDVLDGLGEDGASENGGRGGTITSDLVGLAGNVLEETSAEVLELVLEGDGTSDGHTVLCDLGRAIAGLDEDVAALGSEGGGHGPGESVDTLEKSLPALNAELELLYNPISFHSSHALDPIDAGVPCARIFAG
jgi:hypothetical protein